MISSIATQVLNFFQTTRRVFYWSSLLALVLALLSFPLWHQIFTEHNLPVSVRMAAPGVEYVKVYWDDPNIYPTAYEQIAVNPASSRLWQVNIEALAEKNPQSKGSEIWVLDISTPEDKVDWSKVSMQSGWELRNKPDEPQGKIAVTSGRQPHFLNVLLEGGNLTIKLLRHPWSGKIRVTINNRVREVDLFAANPSTETLTFPVTGIGDEEERNYQINAVDTPWHRLKFVAEGGGNISIKEVKARDRIISSQTDGQFILPFRFWNRLSCALVATIISFFWMTCLFVSTVHLWQGQPDKRFGIWTHLIGLSIFLSGFWTLVFYPGLITPDTINQWEQAIGGQYNDFNPPFMTGLMGVVIKVFGNRIACYTFLQAFLFYLSIFLLLKSLCFFKDKPFSLRSFLLATFVVTFYPIGWIYSVTLVKDVTLTILMIFLAIFLLLFTRSPSNFKYFIVSSMLLGFSIAARHNSVLLFIGVAAIIFINKNVILAIKNYSKPKKIIALILLASTLFYPQIIKISLSVQSSHVSTIQLANLLIGYTKTSYQLTGNIDEKTRNFFDKTLGQGAIEEIVKKQDYPCGTIWSLFVFDRKYKGLNNKFIELEINQKEIDVKRAVVNFLFTHPYSVIQHHLCVITKLINFSNIHNTYWHTLDYYPPQQSNLARNSKIPESEQLVRKVIDIAYYLAPYRLGLSRHWIFLSLLLIVATFSKFMQGNSKSRFASTLSDASIVLPCLGISYFFSLCVVPIAYDWRFLLPVTLLSIILISSIMSSYIVNTLLAKSDSPRKICQKI